MAKYFSILMALGILIALIGSVVAVLLESRNIGAAIFFIGVYWSGFFGILFTFFIKAEIKGKPANSGIRTSAVGFGVLASGMALLMTGINGPLGVMLVVSGFAIMIVGFFIHICYFF